MRRDLKIKTIDVIVKQFCNRIGVEAWADLRRELMDEKDILKDMVLPGKCPSCGGRAEMKTLCVNPECVNYAS
jgi:hypothetical protein